MGMPCLRSHSASNLPLAPPHAPRGTITFLLLLFPSLTLSCSQQQPKGISQANGFRSVLLLSFLSETLPDGTSWVIHPQRQENRTQTAGAELTTPLCTPVTRFLLEATSLRALVSPAFLSSASIHYFIRSKHRQRSLPERMPSGLRGGQCACPDEDSGPVPPRAGEVVRYMAGIQFFLTK